MKYLIFLVILITYRAVIAQVPAYYGTVEKIDYPITPENAVSLCVFPNHDLDYEVILDFPFEFPFFKSKLTKVILDVSSGYYVFTENLEDEDDYNLALFSATYGNFGDYFNICISDVVTYSDTISDMGCFTVEYKDVSHFFDMPFPSTGVMDHRFNFLHKFCEDGSIHFTFGECEIHSGVSFEEGIGFLIPFAEDDFDPYGPWINVYPIDEEDETRYREYAFIMEDDSILMVDEFEPERLAYFPYLLDPGTTLSFRPVINTNVHESNSSIKPFTVYPNPTNDKLWISLQLDSRPLSGSSYRLIDIYGRVIFNNKLHSHQQSLDIQSLSPGVYFLSIQDEKGQIIQLEKILKTF